MARDRITRAGARAPGAEYNPTPWRHTKESSARPSAGQPTLTTRCAKDGGKPDIHRRMPGAGLSRRCTGQTLSDMPAFQPYWGKPAVRNDRGDGGNVGIIRSPLRATVLPDCGGRSAMVVPTATVTGLLTVCRPSESYIVVAHLDILGEALYLHLECLPKNKKKRIELLQGTLDLLILRTLLLGPTHGHAIAKAIEFNSDDVLQVEQGSLYPALHRLIRRGWIAVEAGVSENNRRAKFYRLTAKGRRQLAVETSKWDKIAGAIPRILRPEEREGES